MNRGYVIMAQNTSNVDYVKCATVLALRIKQLMPRESVSIITDDEVTNTVFDNVIKLPYGNVDNTNWKLGNDWQVYEASPYDYTIKLEADLFLPRRIDHWWNILRIRDLNISTTIRNYRNEISDVNYYRQMFIKNNLPSVYNALTYFKKSDVAKEFFSIVRDIFENWNSYTQLFTYNYEDRATTDVVYAIASHIIGMDKCTLPTFTDMSMIHMKKYINNTVSDYWNRELLLEILADTVRINSYTQLYPIHYHIKDLADIFYKEMYE